MVTSNKKIINKPLVLLAGFFIFFVLFSFLNSYYSAEAAFTPQINYQGKLSDSAGDPLEGDYNLRFRICEDTNCASIEWEEERINLDKVTVTGGLFSVMLGEIDSLDSFDFNRPLYFEVSVGGTGVPAWDILLPRRLIGSVPNAFNSQKIDGLTTSSLAVLDRYNEFTQENLFVATTTFTGSISVNGGLNASSTYSDGGYDYQTELRTNYVFYDPFLDDNFNAAVYAYATSSQDLVEDYQSVGIFAEGKTTGVIGRGQLFGGAFQGGTFGVAATNLNDNGIAGYFVTEATSSKGIVIDLGGPQSKGIYIGESAGSDDQIAIEIEDNDWQYGLKVSNSSSTSYTIYSDGGINYFSGNIGIGTTTPEEALSVVGNIFATGNMNLTGPLYLGDGTNNDQSLITINVDPVNYPLGQPNWFWSENFLSSNVGGFAFDVPTTTAYMGIFGEESSGIFASSNDVEGASNFALVTGNNTDVNNSSLWVIGKSGSSSNHLLSEEFYDVGDFSSNNGFTAQHVNADGQRYFFTRYLGSTTPVASFYDDYIFANRIGIGGNPSNGNKFEVYGSSVFRDIKPQTNLVYGLGNSTLRWKDIWTETINIGSSTWSLTASTSDGRLAFLDAPLTGNERFTLLSNGKIGIGTSTPEYNLTVAGDSYFAGNVTTTGDLNVSNNFNIGTSDVIKVSSASLLPGYSLINFENSGYNGGDLNNVVFSMRNSDDNENSFVQIFNPNTKEVSLMVIDSTLMPITTSTFNLGAIRITDGGESRNTAIGNGTFLSNVPSGTTGNSNTAVGWNTLSSNTTGFGNTAMGVYSLTSSTIGHYNTAIGNLSFRYLQDPVGSTTPNGSHYNAAFGPAAGLSFQSGNDNVFIGPFSGITPDFNNVYFSGDRNIFIGAWTGTTETNLSNHLNIGNLLFSNNVGDGSVSGASSGALGVGLIPTSSAYRLQVNGASSLGGDVSIIGNQFITGYVGIGTTTPQAKLHIEGGEYPNADILVHSIATTTGATITLMTDEDYDIAMNNRFHFGKWADSGWSPRQSFISNVGTSSLNFYQITNLNDYDPDPDGDNSGLVALSIDYNRNIGIGTTTPSQKLVVSGTSSMQDVIPESNLTYNLGSSALRWSNLWTETINIGTSTWSINNGDDGRLSFFDDDSGTGNERFSILTNGNVGIGTSTPSYRLTVNSDNSADNLLQVATTTNQNIFTINNDGIARFGLGLEVTGDVDITGQYKINGQSIFYTDPDNYYAGYQAGNAASNTISSVYNVAIGSYALSSNLEVSNSVAIGYEALKKSTSSVYNVAIGFNSLKENLTGDSNVAIGGSALANNISGGINVAIGDFSLIDNITGQANVAIGRSTLANNITGNFNSALGAEALLANQAGNNNSAFGWRALFKNTADNNVAFGILALSENTTGNENVALGSRAGYSGVSLDNDSVSDRQMVFIGYDASRDGSVVASTTSLTNGIAIGYGSRVGGSNMMALGGLGANAVNVGINTSTPGYRLTVVGTSSMQNILPQTNLTYNLGSSTLRWSNLWAETVNIGTSTWSINNGADGRLSFYDQALGLGNERFTMLTDGNIGIGTSTPNSKLTVAGDTYFTGNSTTTGDLYVAGSFTAADLSVSGNLGVLAGQAFTYNSQNLAVASTTLNNYFFANSGNLTMTGANNYAIGSTALDSGTTGYSNIAIGANALTANTTGYDNIAIGINALVANDEADQSIAIGNSALASKTGTSANGSIAIGYHALTLDGAANHAVAIGFEALASSLSGGYNTAVGYQALTGLTTGDNNTAVGAGAGDAITTGADNTALGMNALTGMTSSSDATAIGSWSLPVNTAANSTAIGANSLRANTTGQDNNAFGAGSLYSNIIGRDNSAFGYRSGFYLKGGYNSMMGNYAMSGVNGQTVATSTVAMGYKALNVITSGSRNTSLGYQSGLVVSTGANNVLLGYQAGDSLTTGSNNIIIGYDVDATSTDSSNFLNIGNTIYGNLALGYVGIGTSTPGYNLTVSGGSYLDGAVTTTGSITSNSLTGGATNLTVDANGTIIRDPSDINLKENISPIVGALEKVLGLQGVSFNWKDKDRFGIQEEIGFIAQQVEGVVPQLVSTGGTYKSLKYPNMTALLVEAVKEQQQQIDLLSSNFNLNVADSNFEDIADLPVTESNPQFDTLRVAGATDFYGTITVIGEAGFRSKVTFEEDVEIKGKLYVSVDQAGTVKIPAGETFVEVKFEGEYEAIPKVVASLAGVKAIFYGIEDKTTTGFRIVINEPFIEDLEFDWIALAVKEQDIAEIIDSSNDNSEIVAEIQPEEQPVEEELNTELSVENEVIPEEPIEEIVSDVVEEEAQPETETETPVEAAPETPVE